MTILLGMVAETFTIVVFAGTVEDLSTDCKTVCVLIETLELGGVGYMEKDHIRYY